MEVALPIAASMDCYEDMFKEITRKLYGEEGLPENMSEGGENGQMRCPPDYDNEGNADGHGGALTAFGLAALMQNGFPPHPGMLRMDHIQDAKYRGGLPHGNPIITPTPGGSAAGDDKWIPSDEILQWTGSRIASYNPAQKLFRCADCECVGFLSRVAEHWLGTHANLRVFQCPQCPYTSAWARCVRMHLTRNHDIAEPPNDSVTALYKENPVLDEVTKFLQRLKTKVERDAPTASPTKTPNPKQQFQSPPPQAPRSASTPSNSENTSKRYCCSFCPYATDRRDLFTRHENIHREEKPFQCYVCQKQFNRADHVKKHFLRMHRDYPYDLNRIRRQPPKNASGMSYYHKYNNNPSAPVNNQRPQENQNHPHDGILPPNMHQVPHHLNIPGGFSSNSSSRMPGNVNQQKQKAMHNGCNAKSHGSKTKKKGDKRYSCCYCAWSGVDNWCLKRHLNTHLKPFVCGLCDYKAARSERLATHVLKVHNKKACSRCSYMADDQAQLTMHLQDHQQQHNVAGVLPFQHQELSESMKREHYEYDAMFHQHHRSFVPPPYKNKQQYGGAERLFHYMEVSDNSDPEELAESGILEEDDEPPPFICRVCGCEFIDDTSLETHHSSLHQPKPTVLEKTIVLNDNVSSFRCTVCEVGIASQSAMMEHMRTHSSSTHYCRAGNCLYMANCSSLLHQHVSTVHKELGGAVKCLHCTGICSAGQQIEQHLHQHHATNIVCVLCDNNLRKLGNLAIIQNDTLSNNYLCATDLDSNMNLRSLPIMSAADDQNSLDGMGGSKRPRKQSQPRKVVSDTTSDCDVKVRCHTGMMKRYSRMKKERIISAGMSCLEDKYTRIILTRKRLKCNWCRQELATFPYHTPVSLALHRLWRHNGTKFQCEHCDKRYRHQYQVILHASRVHLNHTRSLSTDSIAVPDAIKEPINFVPGNMSFPTVQVSNLIVPDIQHISSNSKGSHLHTHGTQVSKLDFLPLPVAMATSTLYQQQVPLLPSSSTLT